MSRVYLFGMGYEVKLSQLSCFEELQYWIKVPVAKVWVTEFLQKLNLLHLSWSCKLSDWKA